MRQGRIPSLAPIIHGRERRGRPRRARQLARRRRPRDGVDDAHQFETSGGRKIGFDQTILGIHADPLVILLPRLRLKSQARLRASGPRRQEHQEAG